MNNHNYCKKYIKKTNLNDENIIIKWLNENDKKINKKIQGVKNKWK